MTHVHLAHVPGHVGRRPRDVELLRDAALMVGGDVGVYAHGDNVRDLETMVDYGLPLADGIRIATSGNAKMFHLDDRLGSVKAGLTRI